MFGFRNGRGAVIANGQQIAETLQCVHCGVIWETRPGSGINRGFCLLCKGPLCGKHECMASCTPFEARLDFTDGNLATQKRILSQYPDIKPII